MTTDPRVLEIFDEAYALWASIDWTRELRENYRLVYAKLGTPLFGVMTKDDCVEWIERDPEWLLMSMVSKMNTVTENFTRPIDRDKMLDRFQKVFDFMRD